MTRERPAAVEIAAQAKVNLRLRVLAREASGYHQIETLFLRLALADRVRVRRTRDARSLDVSGPVDLDAIGPVERNLAWRAAMEFARVADMPGGFAIEIEKHIPLGGGLGGGSADAGAVLRALNEMADVPLESSALLGIAASLGADVPFLTIDHPYALAWGRGERMLLMKPPEPRAILLALPGFAVNTADAYGWLDQTRTDGWREGEVDALDHAGLSDWDYLAGVAINDFEPVVAARHAAIGGVVRDWKAAGAPLAMMSGSGSTVFCVASDAGIGSLAGVLAEGVRTLSTRSAYRVESIQPIE